MSTSTPRTLVSPKDVGTSPTSNSQHNGAEQRDDEDGWSGEEDDDDVRADGSRKRKRPMSVSCELCKQRKACNQLTAFLDTPRADDTSCRLNAIVDSRRAAGVCAMARSASTESARNPVFAPGMARSSKRV